MGCMILRRTFHTAPEQEQGPEQGQGRMGYVPTFQVLKLFQVVCFNDISMAFRCPILAPKHSQCEWFLHNIGPRSCLGPGDSQCEYTIMLTLIDIVPVTNFITNLQDSQSVMPHLYCQIRTQIRTWTGWPHSGQNEIPCVFPEFSLCYINFPCVIFMQKLTISSMNKGHITSVLLHAEAYKLIF